MLHCENVFCVYWADDTCWLETVNLDIQGRCDSCIYIDIDEPTLKNSENPFLTSSRGIVDSFFIVGEGFHALPIDFGFVVGGDILDAPQKLIKFKRAVGDVCPYHIIFSF